MSIYKDENSPYLYTRFTVSKVINGKRHSKRVRESTKTTTRTEAERYEALRKKEVADELIYGIAPEKTWADAELKWLREKNGKRTILEDVAKFDWLAPHLRHLPLSQISHKVVFDIMDEKRKANINVAPATLNRYLALIKGVLNRAYQEWGWLDKVPHIRLYPENNERIGCLTQEEFKHLCDKLNKAETHHLYQATRFAIATGLRESNICGLKWPDINFESRLLIVKSADFKNKESYGMPLNDVTLSILQELKSVANSEYVFTYKGKPIKKLGTRAWKKAVKAAGISNFRFHDLRHTAASWYSMSGISTQELKELMGWKTLEMALKYSHLSKTHLLTAANKITPLFNRKEEHETS